MLARLLLGVLAQGMPDESHDRQNEDNASVTREGSVARLLNSELQSASKLHVGMLTISLIVCLAYGVYAGWTAWTGKSVLVGHIRNLVIAFFCRIFFAVLFDGVVVLNSSRAVGGANTLLALECITQNLVFAFWLMLTVYVHAQVQRKFNSEPTLNLYEYGIPGVAVFFAFVWIFVLQAEYPSWIWWGIWFCVPQWIVNSLRLLYLLVQLALIGDMARILLKISMDNDSLALFRKSSAVLLALVFLFWLQFGLSLGRLSISLTSGYLHFDYFIDGSTGGLVCLGLFFFQKWVPSLLNKTPSVRTESGEGYPAGERGLVTIDEVFMTRESGRWKDSDAAEESRDVVYSSVVEPERLKKTLELYKRFNVLPSSQATMVEGEEFFDCRGWGSKKSSDSERVDFRSVISDGPRTPPRKNRSLKPTQTSEQIQKKNAFYASKYLIVDPKESGFPKLLETRPSVSSAGKETETEKRSERGTSSNLDRLMSDEFVLKWLRDHSDNLKKQDQKTPRSAQENFEKTNEHAPERATLQPPTQQPENQEKSSSTPLPHKQITKPKPETENSAADHSQLPETHKTEPRKPPGTDQIEQCAKHPLALTNERPNYDAELGESSREPETSVHFQPRSQRIAESAPRTTESKQEERQDESKREADGVVSTKRQPAPVGTSQEPSRKLEPEEETVAVETGPNRVESQPTHVPTFAKVVSSTLNSFLSFGGLPKRHSDSDASTADEHATKELQQDYTKPSDGGERHPDKAIRGQDPDSEQDSDTTMEPCGSTTEARAEGRMEDELNASLGSSDEGHDDIQYPARASDRILAELTITAVPVPPKQEDSSSDSSFEIERKRSKSPSSPFSIDDYYSGLQGVREKFTEDTHPYAKQAKRAKLFV